MKKKLILAIARMVALACTLAGLCFTVNGQWYESAIAWNATATVLWVSSFASKEA